MADFLWGFSHGTKRVFFLSLGLLHVPTKFCTSRLKCTPETTLWNQAISPETQIKFNFFPLLMCLPSFLREHSKSLINNFLFHCKTSKLAALPGQRHSMKTPNLHNQTSSSS